ncbi:MAG TPA: Tat pathway signal protein [Asticcacaulis sp.]|nr:Tat pathway signal protein [Asticcacaulis sp.]
MKRRALLSLCLSAFALPFLAVPAHASEPKKKGGGEGFTQFPMLTVFTAGSGHRHGTLSVDMGLYTADPKMVDRIKLYMPRLKDAYINRLQAYAANMTSSSLADADYLSSQLQAVTNQVLGVTGARVLIGSVLLN